MASEVLKVDENFKPVVGFVTDDANQFIKMGRIDDTTKGLKVMIVGGTGSGTVTSITQGTGILLSPSPITTTGSVALATAIQPIATLGSALQSIRVNAGATALEYYTPSVGSGTVTSVSVTTANGVSGSVATATTTPAITLTLGAITPSSVNSVVISGSSTPTLAVTGTTTVSGTNTGDQTSVSGNAGTATALQNARTIGGVSFNGTANITVASATGGFTISGGDLVLGTNNITLTGSIASTGSRVTKGWFTDLEVTNAPTLNGVAIPSITSTNTLTNKRVTPRLITTNAPGATPTTNTDNVDIMNFTGLATAITSMTTNLSGTPTDGQKTEFRFTDNGTARAITWGASFLGTTVSLPTTTAISTMLRVLFEWDGSVWRCIAVA